LPAIVGQLLFNPEKNQYGTGHTHGKSEYIYGRNTFMPDEISRGNFQVVKKHRTSQFALRLLDKL